MTGANASAVDAPPLAGAPRGLRAKLLVLARPEFRADVRYVYPDDAVLGGPVCRIDQCGRVARRAGMCSGHGQRWVKQGRPNLDLFSATTDPTLHGQRPYEACLVAGCGYGQHSRISDAAVPTRAQVDPTALDDLAYALVRGHAFSTKISPSGGGRSVNYRS